MRDPVNEVDKMFRYEQVAFSQVSGKHFSFTILIRQLCTCKFNHIKRGI